MQSRRSGRYGKSLLEPVSIRRPSCNYEEFPGILNSDGEILDWDDTHEEDDYTLKAKVARTLITRRNSDIDDNIYMREDAYFVHFRCNMEFLTITDEILWHRHVEKALVDGEVPEKPSFTDLHNTEKGVLTILAVEEHRGYQRLFCQLYEMA